MKHHLQICSQTFHHHPLRLLPSLSLCMYLLNKLLVEYESLLEDLEKGAVPEVQGHPPINGQVFSLVHVGHLKHNLFHRVEGDQRVLYRDLLN